MSGLTVGQKLWFVPGQRHQGEPREVEVTKIGRKWAALDRNDRYRIDKETLVVDSGSFSNSLGRCYLTREEWEDKVRGDRAWAALRSVIDRHWHRPPDITLEAIEQAARALGLTIAYEEPKR